ncbi:MAG: GNAT family protein [Candidatus Eisenbacteria bacterium]
MSEPIVPVVLEGAHVRLEPLDLGRHWNGLRAIGLDPELWRFTASKCFDEPALRRYFDAAEDEVRRGVAVAFVTTLAASGEVIGSTRFGNIVAPHRRAEIGWTWLASPHQRTRANTEAKYLMLRHAFEHWGLLRVEFKTSSTNLKSQNAMRRLGLVEEGTFRSWMFNDDGTRRDTMWFSVIEPEWPAMKSRLEALLAR